jgi:hypothetical protein
VRVRQPLTDTGEGSVLTGRLITQEVQVSARGVLAVAASVALAAGATVPEAAAAATSQGNARQCVLDEGKLSCGVNITAVEAAGLTTVAYLYYRTQFRGTPLKVYKTGGDCTGGYGDVEGQVSDLWLLGWDNRISSIKTFHKCDVKLYDHPYFGGPSSVWIDEYANLGTLGSGWDNRADSFKVS